jgi:H+/Cl- antiporter ClcA
MQELILHYTKLIRSGRMIPLNENPNAGFEYSNKNSRKPKKNISPVFLGSLLIAGGLIAGYFFLFRKLQMMAEMVEQISYSMKAMLLGPMCILFGLFYIIIRPKSPNITDSREKKWFYLFMAVMLLIMAGMYFWIRQYALTYGYSL